MPPWTLPPQLTSVGCDRKRNTHSRWVPGIGLVRDGKGQAYAGGASDTRGDAGGACVRGCDTACGSWRSRFMRRAFSSAAVPGRDPGVDVARRLLLDDQPIESAKKPRTL